MPGSVRQPTRLKTMATTDLEALSALFGKP